MKSQFYIISIILIILAIATIVILLTIPTQLSPLALGEIEKISADITFLKNYIMNVKRSIARDWLNPFLEKRDLIQIKNNEYERKEWIVRAFYDFPDDVDTNSIRIENEIGEIPIQIKWINIANRTGELTFIDNFPKYSTKKYYLYYTNATTYSLGNGDYKKLVNVFENSTQITIETIRYKVVLNKSRGGAIDEFYLKPNLTQNFIYNQANWSFQSLFDCNNNIYAQSNGINISLEVIENGPLLALIKVIGMHGNATIPESFTQYQYYYPDYVIIEEELNLTQDYTCTSLYYGYRATVNYSVVSNYNDGNNNGNADNPNINPDGWMDFYRSDNYFGISLIFENTSQFTNFTLATGGAPSYRYFISKVRNTSTINKGVYQFKILIYPHFGNNQNASYFFNLTNRSFVLTKIKTEELIQKLQGLTNLIQTLNLERGFQSSFTTDKIKRIEIYNGQSDWINTSLNKRIGFYLKSNYLTKLFPIEIDVEFTSDVNPNSIFVTTKGGDFIRSQVSTDNYEESSKFDVNLTNPTGAAINYYFYTYNIDGRNFNVTAIFNGGVTISVYYPNGSCTNICNFAATSGNPILVQANSIAGKYKIITTLNSGTNLSMISTLPKIVLANQTFYIKGDSNNSLLFYVPRTNTSTTNFNITLNCPSASNCYEVTLKTYDGVNLTTTYVNSAGKKIAEYALNEEGGSFYFLEFKNLISVSYLQIQFNGTSNYTSSENYYWINIDNPKLKLILQKNFDVDVNMIYVYYSNDSKISVTKPTLNIQLINFTIVNDYFYWKFLANAFFIKPGAD
jgi:hypothetical protein